MNSIAVIIQVGGKVIDNYKALQLLAPFKGISRVIRSSFFAMETKNVTRNIIMNLLKSSIHHAYWK